MKTKIKIQKLSTFILKSLLIYTICYYSCSDKIKSEVDVFIEQVRNDKYIYDSLPRFSPEVIPTLLKYSNDFKEIHHFPINPLSSYGPIKLTFGECLLWTIENIRVNYGNYDKNSFPSFIPELHIRNDINSQYLSMTQLNEVYDIYYQWWYSNQNLNFQESRKIDPLIDSQFSWK
jgi:Domain of unknown function (DUF4943)